MYYMYTVSNNLHMYYAVASNCGGGSNQCMGPPQPLHDNRRTGCCADCVPIVQEGWGGKKVESLGCQLGYEGNTPDLESKPGLNATQIGDYTYKYKTKRIAVRLFKINPTLPDGSTYELGVGYQIWPAPFMEPPAGGGTPVGKFPKCFDLTEASFPYHVQLHR
jgi:hypothetical protein